MWKQGNREGWGRASEDAHRQEVSVCTDAPQTWGTGSNGRPLMRPELGVWGYGSHLKSKKPPTDTSRERPVPGPTLSTQTQKLLTAPQAVSRVTAEGHRAPCKMAPIMNLVAKLGGSWVLTFDEFKTW